MLIDKNKLIRYLIERLVSSSKARNVAEMNLINELIEHAEGGTFDFDYSRLEFAINDFENYIATS